MAGDLIYHGLIDFAHAPWGKRIYWLRLFRNFTECIAVLTDVPGSPILYPANDVPHIHSQVIEQFGVDPAELALYQITPRHSAYGWTGHYRVTGFSEVTIGFSQHRLRPDLRAVSRREIEIHAGSALPELPAHEDLFRQVLERGCGIYGDESRDIFEAIDVGDLPPFHEVGRGCAHQDDFKRMEDKASGASAAGPSHTSRSWPPTGPPDDLRSLSIDDLLGIGQKFIASLTRDHIAACRYHKPNWMWIADESLRIITELGPQNRRRYEDAASQAAKRARLPREDQLGLMSLFNEPIRIEGGPIMYGNGQHRGCALRFSGAARAVVLIERSCIDWSYMGDG